MRWRDLGAGVGAAMRGAGEGMVKLRELNRQDTFNDKVMAIREAGLQLDQDRYDLEKRNSDIANDLARKEFNLTRLETLRGMAMASLKFHRDSQEYIDRSNHLAAVTESMLPENIMKLEHAKYVMKYHYQQAVTALETTQIFKTAPLKVQLSLIDGLSEAIINKAGMLGGSFDVMHVINALTLGVGDEPPGPDDPPWKHTYYTYLQTAERDEREARNRLEAGLGGGPKPDPTGTPPPPDASVDKGPPTEDPTTIEARIRGAVPDPGGPERRTSLVTAAYGGVDPSAQQRPTQEQIDTQEQRDILSRFDQETAQLESKAAESRKILNTIYDGNPASRLSDQSVVALRRWLQDNPNATPEDRQRRLQRYLMLDNPARPTTSGPPLDATLINPINR